MSFWLVSWNIWTKKINDKYWWWFLVAVDNLADAENLTAAEEEEQKKRDEVKLGEVIKPNGDVKGTEQ